MDGESPKLSATTDVVFRYIQRNREQPPSTVELAKHFHCSLPVVFQAVKTLLRSGKLGTQRSNGAIVYVARPSR